MVSLAIVKESNASISSSLPAGLVAVIVGGTSGIGEFTLKEFARHVQKPRIYNIGRSQPASDRIEAECKKLNPEVQYSFIKADISLIRNVDSICEEIKRKEKAINVLILSQGTLAPGAETEEGLHFIASLIHHSRARFIYNLLPLLQAATGIRRVVNIFCGSKEGPINLLDLQLRGTKAGDLIKQRGHGASIITLISAHFSQIAPTVSFIHDFPGFVKTNIARDTRGLVFGFMKVIGTLFAFRYIPALESRERHLYLATSARYPPAEGRDEGVRLSEEIVIARGIDGAPGGGVYSTDEANESAGPAVEDFLKSMKKDGMVEKVWKLTDAEYARIAKLPNI